MAYDPPDMPADFVFEPSVGGEEVAVGSVSEFFGSLYSDYVESGYDPDPLSMAIAPDAELQSVEVYPSGLTYGDYDELRTFLQGTDLSGGERLGDHLVEAHHLLSATPIANFGLDPGEIPAVALDWRDAANDELSHAYVTAEINNLLTSGAFYDIDQLVEAHAQVYEAMGQDAWVERVEDYVRDHRDDFIAAYETGAVPGSDDDDWQAREERVIDWLLEI